MQYGNPWEAPPIGYGTIPNYEYQLPAGWSMNGNTSNGTTWIAGDNNEMITSDANTGNNSIIRIRPVNTQCGAGLVAGQQVQIPISRPRPPLAIAGDDVICSGTKNYTISGPLPPGATVCWNISSPNGAATIPSSPFCGTSLPVTFNAVGRAIITATITDCIETYTLAEKQVITGTPALPAPNGVPSFNLVGQRIDYGANGPGNQFSVCTFENLIIIPYFPLNYPFSSITNHQWTLSGTYNYGGSLNLGSLGVQSSSSHPSAFQFTYRYQNACGWSPFYSGEAVTINCDGGEEPFKVEDHHEASEDSLIRVYPNPVNDVLYVSINKKNYKGVVARLIAVDGKEVKKIVVNAKLMKINLSTIPRGLYLLQITDGNKISTHKILKN